MPNFTPEIDPDDQTQSGIMPEGAIEALGKDEQARLDTQATRAIRHGSGQSKRSDVDTEMDYVEEARLYLGGYTITEIATYIGTHRSYSLSYNTVYDDLKIVRQRWIEQQIVDMSERQAQELSRIDKVEKEYWEAWENSKKAKEIIEQNKANDQWLSGKGTKGKAGYTRDTIKRKHETRDPNVEYLKGIERCIEQRCRILGLYAPQTVNVNWRQQAKEAGINPDGFVDDLADQFFKNALVAGHGGSGGMGDSPTTPDSQPHGDPVSEVPD